MGDAALGLCLALGGSLTPREDTPRVVQITLSDRHPALFDQVETEERYLAHPRCMVLCEGMEAIVQSPEGVLGLYQRERKLYGMAFQVEQNDPDGVQLLVNSAGVCAAAPPGGATKLLRSGRWRNPPLRGRRRSSVRIIRRRGQRRVCPAGQHGHWIQAALHFCGYRLLRKGEGDRVMSFYKDTVGLNLTR